MNDLKGKIRYNAATEALAANDGGIGGRMARRALPRRRVARAVAIAAAAEAWREALGTWRVLADTIVVR